MVYKIIDNGEEINRIVADEAFISAYTAETGYTAELIEPEPQPDPQPTIADRMTAVEEAVEILLSGRTE